MTNFFRSWWVAELAAHNSAQGFLRIRTLEIITIINLDKCPSSPVLYTLPPWHQAGEDCVCIACRTMSKRLQKTVGPAVTLDRVFDSQVPLMVTDTVTEDRFKIKHALSRLVPLQIATNQSIVFNLKHHFMFAYAFESKFD